MAFNKGKGNWKKHTKEGYNKNFQKKRQAKKRDEHYLSKFKGRNIEVRNGDVNGAIKRLKKVLERMDFQKELAKREYYEKPSVQRKRRKDTAIKKQKKDLDKMISTGEWMPTPVVGQKHLKGKRSRRKVFLLKEKVNKLRRR